MATIRRRIDELEERAGTNDADEPEVIELQFVDGWRTPNQRPADDDPALDALMLSRGHRKVGPSRYACTPPGGPR